ncbi:hypothetical protein PHLCEN_2v4231 [Hermanssonia centrifuga]|uniref:Uncharacterized protein n=1 Tax=Hermanssonia centrifuga TaxID=98765 RepID=A0A2R6PYT1_9APHY|nr:hypothetical protein PHLCEN_2v4231 [Hermanssonia centrifuga]
MTTGPPLLFALGLRILLNTLDPSRSPDTPDFLLIGLWQGVLLSHSLAHLPRLVLPIGLAITAKLLFIDFLPAPNTTQCACTLLGTALGVLFTDILTQLFEHGRFNEREPRGDPATTDPVNDTSAPSASRRLRLVSFDKTTTAADQDRRHHRRALAASPAPTTTHTHTSALTLDSDIPSSIDPTHRLTPLEREVAVLRARASLADSERRRFKEEKKWALSQGNRARASQLAWQVKRYAALMESFHREADAKVVDAARAAAQPSTYRTSIPTVPSRAQPSSAAQGAPLVSVTVGNPSRTRKRSGGSTALKPAIYIHGRQ